MMMMMMTSPSMGRVLVSPTRTAANRDDEKVGEQATEVFSRQISGRLNCPVWHKEVQTAACTGFMRTSHLKR